MPADKKPDLFALLVGIDYYSQVPLDNGVYYPHLGGCVRDIKQVEQMLQNRFNVPPAHITKLTSTVAKNGWQLETGKHLPTYKNIVKAFKNITETAQAGDQIYIHYSGHGGRSATMFKELKGENGLDESLVPCDIGDNRTCYLRDLEMAYLLKAMSDKGLIVTLVLDSCHSGGASGGSSGATVREIQRIDRTPPPKKSAVASIEELIDAWNKQTATTLSTNIAASGWGIPTPNNFVLLAACRAHELANEYAFDGTEKNGALTYWMLDAVKQIGADYTYKMLCDRIVAKVHAKFVDQTPQIEGDGNRKFFGDTQLTIKPAINIIKIDLIGNRVQLNTGLAQGIVNGAQFAIYPANETDFSDLTKRLAVVESDNPGATETWTNIIEAKNTKLLTEGAQAVILSIGTRLHEIVHVVNRENSSKDLEHNKALEKLPELIQTDDSKTKTQEKWTRFARKNDETDNFHHSNFNLAGQILIN